MAQNDTSLGTSRKCNTGHIVVSDIHHNKVVRHAAMKKHTAYRKTPYLCTTIQDSEWSDIDLTMFIVSCTYSLDGYVLAAHGQLGTLLAATHSNISLSKSRSWACVSLSHQPVYILFFLALHMNHKIWVGTML
jgi:hypothetical protein